MGTVWIKEFTGGLDTRRMRETTPGGVLLLGRDGHITRGGEFQQRAAFVPAFTLPAGTVGLAAIKTGLVVFGSGPAPTMPSGVVYQRLQQDGGPGLVRVLSTDLYAGKVYAVGEFADGSIAHFYDGARVTDWFDGRPRAGFQILGGEDGDEIRVFVDGAPIGSGPTAWAGSTSATAAALAADITATATTPEFTASASGSTVNILGPAGSAMNGRPVTIDVTGLLSVSTASTTLSGGAESVGAQATGAGFSVSGAGAQTSTTYLPKLGATNLVSSAVAWAGSAQATAAAIAAAINAYSTVVTASVGASIALRVVLTTVDNTDAYNGIAPTVTVVGSTSAEPILDLKPFAGGVRDQYMPGTFVKTVRSKMYSVSGSILHMSGINAPTLWATDTVGAGFEDLSTEDAQADELKAVARYQGYLAVFAPSVVMIWFVDPDPTLNTLSQVLSNTGTAYPNSVTPFGDSDVFYLDSSGLRSLRARDSSNAAATTDIGVPVDSLIVEKLAGLEPEDVHKVFGLINPTDKRFWLVIKDEIFVFTFYQNAKVSAWTTYTPSTPDEGAFDVDAVALYADRPYLRSGDAIYVYGGASGALAYDATPAEAWTPYLDANRPTAAKQWQGLDVACRGLWEVSAGVNPNDLDAAEIVARVWETTYPERRIPFQHECSHVSLRFRYSGDGTDGPAVLSAAVLHYQGDEEEA